MSRFGENGSHLEAADAAESYARLVDGPGSSGNTGIGSHLAEADAAKGLAWQADGLGGSEFAKNGSHLAATYAAEGRAESRWQRKCRKRLTPGSDGSRKGPGMAGGRPR